jgi:hypothetical protein
VSKDQWFGFDPLYDSDSTAIGCVSDVLAVQFGDYGDYQCFVYIDVFVKTVLYNYTDYTVDFASRCTTRCIPLKCICSAFWLVSHWDPATYPPKSCLLLIKHL